MRHKYSTTAFVLSRIPLSEASSLLTLLTPEFGILRVRVQGVRKSGAKLAPALQTLSESDVTLVRGKDVWRLSGAILGREWFRDLSIPAREAIGRTISLLIRLVHGELHDDTLFNTYDLFINALKDNEENMERIDAAECLAILRFLQILGVDAGEIPGGMVGNFSEEALDEVSASRQQYVLRINRGITASGL